MLMKSIGNIVCEKLNIKVSSCFNKCLSINGIDTSLPTLIIGLESARNTIKDFDILVKQYENGMIWWTFSKSEKRNENIDDIERFKDYCIKRIIGDTDYDLFDVINATYSETKDKIKLLNNPSLKCWYNDRNRFIFIHSFERKKVFGISLDTCEYCGIEKQKILKMIENGNGMKQIFDFDIIPEDISKHLQYSDVDKIILFDFFS